MKLKEVWAAAFLLLLPTTVMAEDLIRIGLFNKDAVIIAAQEKGLLKAENIRVEINTVTDSPTLLRNLISGRYDLILNNADNVIAWAEGQGADPQKNDFVIFLGGSQGVNQRLAVHPSINDYNDINGKVLAVDAPTTGYAIVMIAILKKHGLELNRDYTLKSFGNTNARAEAIGRGEAVGAMMGMTDEEIQKRGFKVLARSEDHVARYARGLGATRREWANASTKRRWRVWIVSQPQRRQGCLRFSDRSVLHRGLIVMYWSKQEQLAFDIILLLLVGFQIATVSLYAQNSLNNGILLVATN